MVLWIILQLLFVAVAVASNGSSVQMCPDHERQALLAFKMGFSISNDPFWEYYYCGDYAYAKTNSWSSSSDCCEWDGVTCDSLSGHVVELDLSCSLLTGSFPSNSTLFLLRRLRHLSLAFNYFSSSPIPPGLGQLSHLTFLDLSNSGFSGQVPREIGWLSHLATLDLSYNLLNGSFSSNSTLFLLRRLRHLSLASNSFSSSPIPPGLGQLSHLTYLDLSYSGFSGQVPREIGWLSHLATLDLSYNDQLKMPNFQTIMGANLTHLRKLDISGVNISSNLPPIIANLSKLSYLGLSFCGLQGEFPAVAVLSLPELRVVLLDGNSGLHADFSAVQYWRSPLEVVHFTMCILFTGKLPESIGDPSNSSLQSFRIAGCQFYGDIPSWMWTVAEDIELGSSGLSGSLPTNVNTTMLAGLSSIDLSVPVLDDPTGFEEVTASLLAISGNERSFKNSNFLLAEVQEMSTPTASVTKGKSSRGGRSSARLSGKNLLEQRRSAFKASSSAKGPTKARTSDKVVILDSPPSKVSGMKRKAIAAPDSSPGMLRERSVEDLVAFDDEGAKKEIGDLHPIDCVNEGVVAAWKIFQYSRVASVGIQELIDQGARKVARLEETLKVSTDRLGSLERELSSVKRDYDGRLEAARVKMEKRREEDGRIAGDVGAYYCLKSRLEMMEEFAAGFHTEWKMDDTRADLEMMYPNGNPGAELFKLAGLCVEEDVAPDDAEEEVPQADQEATSGKEMVPVEKSGES